MTNDELKLRFIWAVLGFVALLFIISPHPHQSTPAPAESSSSATERAAKQHEADIAQDQREKQQYLTHAAQRQEPEPKPLTAAEKQHLREEGTRKFQRDVWRDGLEMTVKSRGTTLYLEYVLAGDAFAFNFGETVLNSESRSQLRKIGYAKVLLSDGLGRSWTWNL